MIVLKKNISMLNSQCDYLTGRFFREKQFVEIGASSMLLIVDWSFIVSVRKDKLESSRVDAVAVALPKKL